MIVDIDGFQFYSCIRQHTTNSSGDVGIFFKKCYTKFIVLAHKGKHVIALKISEEVFGFNVLVLCIYIPPEGSPFYYVNAFAEIEAVIADNREDNDILLLGDLNARTSNETDYVTPNARIETLELMANEVDILLEQGIRLERLSQDNRLYCAFIDYRKAFDSVNCTYIYMAETAQRKYKWLIS